MLTLRHISNKGNARFRCQYSQSITYTCLQRKNFSSSPGMDRQAWPPGVSLLAHPCDQCSDVRNSPACDTSRQLHRLRIFAHLDSGPPGRLRDWNNREHLRQPQEAGIRKTIFYLFIVHNALPLLFLCLPLHYRSDTV